MGSPDQKSDGIKKANSDGNTEVFPVGNFDCVTFGSFESEMIGVAYPFKLGGELGCKEVVDGIKEDNR